MDPHKNRIGNCESCLKMRFLVQIPEKCENANSNAKSFKNAKKNASISGKGLVGSVYVGSVYRTFWQLGEYRCHPFLVRTSSNNFNSVHISSFSHVFRECHGFQAVP